MPWREILRHGLPILGMIIKWWITRRQRAENQKLREAVREEYQKRVAVERDAELRDRASDSLDERRRRAGWTGGGHEE